MKKKAEFTTPRRELIRQEFLTKAAEVFEKKGFAQTRIHDVAQALELSRSALYHYFKSKDEILEALVEEHTGQAAERMEGVARNHPGSPVDKLRALLSDAVLGRLSGGARIRVLDQLAAEMPPTIKQKFERGRRRILDLYVKLIEDGIAASELPGGRRENRSARGTRHRELDFVVVFTDREEVSAGTYRIAGRHRDQRPCLAHGRPRQAGFAKKSDQKNTPRFGRVGTSCRQLIST